MTSAAAVATLRVPQRSDPTCQGMQNHRLLQTGGRVFLQHDCKEAVEFHITLHMAAREGSSAPRALSQGMWVTARDLINCNWLLRSSVREDAHRGSDSRSPRSHRCRCCTSAGWMATCSLFSEDGLLPKSDTYDSVRDTTQQHTLQAIRDWVLSARTCKWSTQVEHRLERGLEFSSFEFLGL